MIPFFFSSAKKNMLFFHQVESQGIFSDKVKAGFLTIQTIVNR